MIHNVAGLRRLIAGLVFVLGLFAPVEVFAQNAGHEPDGVEAGRRIYTEGILTSGKEMTGTRFGSTAVSGAVAACVNCHRRSGMGQVEGDIQVPPIAGKFLYGAREDKQIATMDPRVSKSFNQAHDPYTDTSFADAVIHGVNIQGRKMNVVMPRYNLSEPDLKALSAYLKQLSTQWSPGVSADRIRFATVITPDVDPLRRKVFVDMMQTIVHQKNGSTEPASSGHSRHHMVSAAELILGTERKWDLDIWELHGAPDSWGAQLAEYYRKQPVFALVSGISGSTWQPVHEFCDREHIPCWFPSIPLPARSQSHYAFYFSDGVRQESDVLARHLLGSQSKPKRLIQIYRDDAAERAASEELEHALEGSAIKVENHPLKLHAEATDSLAEALAGVKSGDAVMCWLRESDVAELRALKPVPRANYYFSSRLANAERLPLPANWKANSHLVYLYELPEKRELSLNYFHAWMNLRKIPMVDEPLQSEVFFALSFMTDIISEMLDNLYRDYLVERSEIMLSKRERVKAEQETRDRLYLGRAGDLVKKHGAMTADENVRLKMPNQVSATDVTHGTTIYPRLSLGAEQRFASKGGYVLRFAEGPDNELINESGWIVP